MAKRRNFTDQFKAKIVFEALRGDKPSPPQRGPTEAEIKDLHAKIGRLAVENDFLSQGLKR